MCVCVCVCVCVFRRDVLNNYNVILLHIVVSMRHARIDKTAVRTETLHWCVCVCVCVCHSA